MDKTLQDAISAANLYGLTDAELATVVEAAIAGRRAEAATPGRVVMVHPHTGASLLAEPDAVEVYEQSGWQVKAADPAPTDDATTPAKTTRTKKSED